MKILPNISRSKGNQTKKVGRLIEYNKKNLFLQKSCRKAVRLVSDHFLFFKKVLYEVKANSKWSPAWFQCTLISLNLAYNKNKFYKTLDYWFRYMLKFNFLGKSLGKTSPAHFVYDFSRTLSDFNSLHIGQFVLCNCLLTRLWRH